MRDVGGHRISKYDDARIQVILDHLNAERNSLLRAPERIAQDHFDEAEREAAFAAQFSPDAVLSKSEREAAAEPLPLV